MRGSDEIEAEWSIITLIQDAVSAAAGVGLSELLRGIQRTSTADELIGDELRGWQTITVSLGRAA